MSIEKLQAGNVVPEKRLDYLDHVFSMMKSRMHGSQKGGLLLKGDPGVGKTSFVKQLAQVMGVKLVVVETPHLVEEHIVNIPFIVYHPESNAEVHGTITGTKDNQHGKFSVSIADSDLYNQIAHTTSIPEKTALAGIYRIGGLTKQLHEELGGDKDSFAEEVEELRNSYRCILFLDEYYRETSAAIRNMLRGILDNKIGLHEMPKTVYTIFASNMNGGSEEGIEPVAGNQDFRAIEFDAPGKDEWFNYLIKRYTDDVRNPLDKHVLKAFYDVLEETHISHHDFDADVRMSPRRWEQLITYVNASLPCKDSADARNLMKNVHINFRNYKTGAKSVLAKDVFAAVAKLIKKTSNIDLGDGGDSSGTGDADWRDTLKHQIEVKMKQGEARHYIPVISGLPGVGKTSHVFHVAYELGLVPVYINVSNLSAEDVIGLPVANTGKGEKKDIAVEFSTPMLKQIIDRAVRDGEADLQKVIKAKGPQVAGIDFETFQKREHKYLIFFDELNRTSTKVFNALRRVILEKKFSDDVGLPNGSIVIAAINPHDLGTTQLTGHMRDVLDIIPAGATWRQTEAFLKTKMAPELEKQVKNPETVPGVLKTLDAMYLAFSSPEYRGKTGTGEDGKSEFHMNIGSSDIYISPREWSDMFAGTVHYIDRHITRFKRKAHEETDSAKIQGYANEVRTKLYEGLKTSLDWIVTHKHDSQAQAWFDDFRTWVETSPEADNLGLTHRKAAVLKPAEIFTQMFRSLGKIHLSDEPEFVNYMRNVDAAAFKHDVEKFVIDEVQTDRSFMSKPSILAPILEINPDGTTEVRTAKNAEEFYKTFDYLDIDKEKNPVPKAMVLTGKSGEHSSISMLTTADVAAKQRAAAHADVKHGQLKVTRYEAFLLEIIIAVYHHGLSREFLDSINNLSFNIAKGLLKIYDSTTDEGKVERTLATNMAGSAPNRLNKTIRTYGKLLAEVGK
jgi:MoxR-like ATPase